MSSKNKLNKLFENSDSEDESTLKTNSSYAKHYDEFRKKEILSHLKNISDESDSSDDASTDEELVNPAFDKEFLKSLAFLKSKDPKKYEKIPSFFENVPTVEDTIKEKQLYKSKKPVTVADYQRERLIKTDGRMSEDDEDDEDAQNNSMTYIKEQEKIKNELKQALEDSSEEEGEENLFKVRDKPREEVEKEDEDYLKWLAGQKNDTTLGADAKVLEPLKDFWTSRNLPKADQFLKDYIVNKRYMDNTNTASYEDVVGLSEDEEEVEQQAEFETKYNFRFEEPDNEFIKRFPRSIEDSVRADDNSRREKRKERQERKVKEKELKMKDLRELQNIRKREIEQKLLLLKEVAGNEELALKEDDLNSDFDPDEHDRRMSEMFNNEYYGIDEGDQKPEFPDIDEELNIENWDNFDKTKIPGSPAGGSEVQQNCEDDDFIMDCDYDPEQNRKMKLQNELIEMSRGRKRRKKISKLAEIIKKEKPTYDPATEKTYEEYLDEYYKLDYEDIIGDQPCRFRYTECVPNDFGLTVEEILLASNKELNQWASLKKTMQNRPKNVEMNDVEKYNRRRNNTDLKKKIFVSMYGQPESDDDEQSGVETTPVEKIVKTEDPKPEPASESSLAIVTIKKKKKRKTNVKGATAVNGSQPQQHKSPGSQAGKKAQNNQKGPIVKTLSVPNANKRKLTNQGDSSTSSPQNPKKMKLNQKGNFKKAINQSNSNELSEGRLKAFGINPKKFKNKLKYSGKKQQGSHQTNNKKPFQKKKLS